MACLSPAEVWKPFDASYEHHRDEYLTLLNIRTQLPVAEGAFVPACHMAELADKDFVEGGQYLGSGAWSGQYSR